MLCFTESSYYRFAWQNRRGNFLQGKTLPSWLHRSCLHLSIPDLSLTFHEWPWGAPTPLPHRGRRGFSFSCVFESEYRCDVSDGWRTHWHVPAAAVRPAVYASDVPFQPASYLKGHSPNWDLTLSLLVVLRSHRRSLLSFQRGRLVHGHTSWASTPDAVHLLLSIIFYGKKQEKM